MGIQITKRDLIWTYASYILQTGASFLLLPILLNNLSSKELAIWYIFLSIGALINLLDFGLQPTIMRNVSYIFNGARKLSKQGIVIQNKQLSVDYSLLKSLILTVKKIYIIISVIIAGTMFTFGSIYVRGITSGLGNQQQILNAWYVYVLSIVLNFYFYYYTPLLLGRGKIAESNKTIAISKLTFIIIAALGLFKGYGLMAVAIGNIVASVVNRITSYYYFYDKELKMKLNNSVKKNINLLPILWTNAYKLGLVSIGAFLITKGNTLIASKYLTLEIVAQYGLTLQVIMLLSTISSIFFITYLPRFNGHRMTDNLDEIRKDYSKSLFVMNTLYFTGSLVIYYAGNLVLSFLGSNTVLLPKIHVMAMLIILYLEMNHSNCANLITTKNEIPFVKSALLSGTGVLVFGLISVKYLNTGILGLILAQGFVQLIYNNWKWPVEVCKDLKMNYYDIIKMGFFEWKKYLIGYKRSKYKE